MVLARKMASHVFVVDSTFKRTQIKVTPGKYLREILEEACKTRKLSPEEYTLKSQSNKPIDLSQPFRLSGLSAGAKLQLVQASKSPGVVSVALQLPESEGGGRLSDKFPSTTSIWLILRKYEDAVAGSQAQKLNLTQRGVPSDDSGQGRLMYEQPCLNVLGRNLESFTDLQRTLAQLGLNGGSALMRLSFKRTEKPLEEAMGEISGYFSSVQPKPTASGNGVPQVVESGEANGAVEEPGSEAAAPHDVPTTGEVDQEHKSDISMPDAAAAPSDQDIALPSSSQPQTEPAPSSTDSTPAPSHCQGPIDHSVPTATCRTQPCCYQE